MSSGIIGGSRYRVICDLGRGGMADVQLALQINRAGVERLVVIKRVRPELAREQEFAAMFLEEARIAAALSHQNVIQTYEVGQDEHGYLIVLEFLRGQAYSTILEVAGNSDYRVSVEVLLGTLQGLEYAHALKNLSGREMSLVHRDISPANVFVTYDGQVKVLDFGIAKTLESTIQTNVGVIKGKVAYMAPEQMRGEAADLRADLYAVGAMLWEATAGRPRFEYDLPDVAIVSSVSAQLAPLTPGAIERGLPGLADEICKRALAHDPQQRYESAEQFHDDLLTLAELIGGRISPRVLGQHVADLFAAERRALQQNIDDALEAWELEKLSGSVSENSLPIGHQVTRIVAQSGSAEPHSPTSLAYNEVPTGAGFQSDNARRAATPSLRKWGVALAGVALLVASYVISMRIVSPMHLQESRDRSPPAITVAARPNPVAGPSTAPPGNVGAAGRPSAGTPQPDRTSTVSPAGSKTKPWLAARRTLAPVGSASAHAAVAPGSSVNPKSESDAALDRSNPWAP